MSKASENTPVDIPARSKAKPVEAGEPVENIALSQQGATFAERAAAREKAAKQVSKASAEDKAVTRSSSKRAGRK
jgi:hypothetical protein